MVDPRAIYQGTAVFYDEKWQQTLKNYEATPLLTAILNTVDEDVEQKILALIPKEKQAMKVRNFNKLTISELHTFCRDNGIATNRPMRDILKDLFGEVETVLADVTLDNNLDTVSKAPNRIFNQKTNPVFLAPCQKLVDFQSTELKRFLPDPKPKGPKKNRAPNLSDILEEKTIDLSEEPTPSGLVEQKSIPQIDLDAADADLFNVPSNVPSSSVTANPIESGLAEEKLREEKVMPGSEEESSMVNTETYAATMDPTLAVLFAKLSMLQNDLGMDYAKAFIPSEIDAATIEGMIKRIQRFVDSNDIGKSEITGAAVSLLADSSEEMEQVMGSLENELRGKDLTEAIAKKILVDRILTNASRKLSQLTGRVRPADDPSDGFRAGDPFGGGRRRTDFEVAIKSPMQPMESYVWTDLGWLNPALSVFHGKTNGQLAIRQGDLVFRPRGKESSHVLDTTWNPTHFMGIALTGKSLMFAGQKINFPVALGGGLTTYNRSRAPLTPFVTLNPSMDSKCIEVLEGHHRSVGSLRHTERGSIVSLGWSVRGGPADTIVCY